jgi:hypothetical protein
VNKIRFSTYLLTLTATVMLFGYMSPAFAGKKCDADPTHPSCPGGDDPKPATGYTAALVYGPFRFDAVDVSVNRKGNSWSSTVKLDMVRPDDGTPFPDGQDSWAPGDQAAWDDVFSVCGELFSGVAVDSVRASDTWSIDNGGPKNAGKAGSNIRIQFRDVAVPSFPGADLDFALIGVIEAGNELPPESGSSSVFELTKFSLFGAGEPPLSCASGGDIDLLEHSFLVITGK